MKENKRKKQEKNIHTEEEERHIISNPIAKGVESSIAMGIDTTYAPLPLWFSEKEKK
ncbi:hypothetical protein [Clostridium sp. BL-8]|uniref:hypothetical protein n=1 Tax=Clostridium sp. BL-8 TaxID=349938 RepID=UPI0009D04761|nr:hypothetical protein [Clostridium sp. BL-8]OOM80975.1 hypothetical protein CLOBL_05740 [Clostridium sp. BL-8]